MEPGRRAALGAGVAVLTIAAFLKLHLPVGADQYDDARLAHPDLFQAYYDEGLLEYCGLLSRESIGGFRLRRDELLAGTRLSEAEHRKVRIAAGIAIDYQYQNHGLSGQRLWCKTEGRDAYDHFVARYRAGPSKDSGAQ
jgi:hypothetical protein